MTRNPHPLTETAAAELWDVHVPQLLNFQVWILGHRNGILSALRATYDAGREHERAQADPFHDTRPWQDCTVGDIRKGDLVEARSDDLLRIGVAHHQDADGNWHTEEGWALTYGDHWPLRRIPAPTEKATTMTETAPTAAPSEPLARTFFGVPDTHGAPHHNVKAIRDGDFVAQVNKDGFIRSGIAYYQDEVGDWFTEDDRLLTWAADRADRPDAVTVWLAPTPPAVEVEMPGEPHLLTNVVLSGGEKIAEATWTGAVLLYARHPLATSLVVAPVDQIEQWTLDGTRARRDGDRADGTPRFVKVQEGEK